MSSQIAIRSKKPTKQTSFALVPVVLDFDNNNTIFHTGVLKEETNITSSFDIAAELDLLGPEDHKEDNASASQSTEQSSQLSTQKGGSFAQTGHNGLPSRRA